MISAIVSVSTPSLGWGSGRVVVWRAAMWQVWRAAMWQSAVRPCGRGRAHQERRSSSDSKSTTSSWGLFSGTKP
eukprot:5230238-Pyramimonas_sp.AAC.2